MKDKTKHKILEANKENRIEILFEGRVKIKNKYYIPIRCLDCKTTGLHRGDQLTKGVFACKQCVREKWKVAVNKVSEKFNIVDDTSSNAIQIHCLQCNTVFAIQSGHLTAFKCRGCVEASYIHALQKRNCKYIRRYTKQETGDTLYIVYENILGEVFEVQSGHLLSGNWLEFKPKEYGAVKLYVIEFFSECDNLWYFKIGVSVNPEYRLKSLKITHTAVVKEIHSFPSRKQCLEFETKLHKTLVRFKADENLVKTFSGKLKLRNGVMKHDGVSEWFCSESKELFEKELLNAISIEN